MIIKRAMAPITKADLKDLLNGSVNCLKEYYIYGKGIKWNKLYNIKKPLVVALCQGAAMHYYDKSNGIKDFDIWFFYPFNKKHLPYRTIWNWDYTNPKFGRHPSISGYEGRKVDVIVRSIKNYTSKDPVKTIYQYFESENTASSRELAKKAVVLLSPTSKLGETIWYKQKI